MNLSTREVEWEAEFEEVNSGAIWDIKISPDEEQVCVAVGNQLCVQSLGGQSSQQKFDAGDSAVLCCEWNESGNKVELFFHTQKHSVCSMN